MFLKTYLFFSCLSVFIILTDKNLYSQSDSLNYYYYPNGSISSYGKLINGIPNGQWLTFFPNGVLKSKGNWVNGNLDGLWQFFDSEGNIKKTIYYRNGKKYGASADYQIVYNKGVYSVFLFSLETYENDERVGKGMYYNSKGCLEKVIPFKKGIFHGKGVKLDCDSNFVEFIYYQMDKLVEIEKINSFDSLGNRTGKWVWFNSNYEVKEEITYKNGLKNGWHRTYKSNGDIDISILYNDDEVYSSDSSEGLDYIEYLDSNQRQFVGSFYGSIPVGMHISCDSIVCFCIDYNLKGNVIGRGNCFSNGLKEGEWQHFATNGKLSSRGVYRKGTKQGIWNFFFDSGDIEQIGSFFNGKEQGQWIWYSRAGKIRKIENYEYGNRNGEYFEYDSIGNQIVRGSFYEGLQDKDWIVTIGDIVWKGFYNFGELDGRISGTYLNGNPYFEGSFLSGTQTGTHKYFYENGLLKEKQMWERGVRVGTWEKYNDQGIMTISITYKNGEEFLINGVKVNY